jgi:Phage integrase family
VARDPLLEAVDLHGAHDLRHTFATWLEDAGIPARVIDELMGHQASSRGGLRGSAIGAHYRHTTPEMAARVVAAIQLRLTVVLGVAELAVERLPDRSTFSVFSRAIHRELGQHSRDGRATSSLSGFCTRVCFCRIAPATCANDAPLRTVGNRSGPMVCGPNVDHRPLSARLA